MADEHGEPRPKSSKGRVLAFLRTGSWTVNDLADALGLTDNAVRAHLAGLGRDGLVESAGVRRGVSKPSLVYRLTAEAEKRFARAYEPVLRALVGVADEQLGAEATDALLRETGRRLAGQGPAEGSLPARLEVVVAALGDLGAVASVDAEGGRLYVRGRSCPLAGAVAEQPAVCRLVEALVAELAGTPVRACCDVADRPRCCFEVLGPQNAACRRPPWSLAKSRKPGR